MAAATTTYQSQDLVLSVGPDYDPSLIRLDAYEPFIDALCDGREFQMDAIRDVCRFLAGGEYANTSDLATESYGRNGRLADRYGSLDAMLHALPFPSKLACSVDHATGTGKSFVLYGIARVMLASGAIDRVLLLCPSLTIESGLAAKFKALANDATLKALLPSDAVFPNAEIVDANVTTSPGDICIENIDATYRHVKSSVRDSFAGQGERTLVLCDEAHHIYSPSDRSLKRWKELLDDEEFGFTRIVGASGTCYIGNEYFPDVVARYSLRKAMDDGRIKEVRYVSKDESNTQDERFQKYIQLHRENAQRHRSLKPLSIIVAGKIDTAADLASDFTAALAAADDVPVADAARRVLVVSSRADHKDNVTKLAYVDRGDDLVEWIFSVSMLTEGWDVHNVFQVVPHEKRAFNSKLLISQVLGRGLRIPDGLTRPALWVFNHSSWSNEIKNLVDEVLEQDRRLASYPVTSGEHSAYHLTLHHLSYETRVIEQELSRRDESADVHLFKRGFVQFETQPPELERSTTFTAAHDGKEYTHTTTVHYTAHSVGDIVQRLRARLKSIDADGETAYATTYTAAKLETIVRASLDRIGETRSLVSEANLQQLYRAMGNTQREVARAARIELIPEQLFEVSTTTMRSRSVAISSFRREATVFYDSESAALSSETDQLALAELIADDAPFPRQAAREVTPRFYFRSPVNVVLTSHAPERQFVRALFEPAHAERLSGWIKSPDTGFYEIAFSWRKGDHTKQAKFNPDLFLRLADGVTVLVVELKDDGDVSDENRAKLKYAKEHFARVNSAQSAARYHMKFLSPGSYDAFFKALREGATLPFMSALQAALDE